jgi:hypothetical protein
VEAIDGARRAIAHFIELVGRKSDVERDDRFAAEHFPRKRRIESDRVKIEIGRGVEQGMFLPGGKREELALRHPNDAVSDREARRPANHEVQLGLSVEMTRALSADGLSVLPHERTLSAVGHERLMERSRVFCDLE